jgi:hypothetical protein
VVDDTTGLEQGWPSVGRSSAAKPKDVIHGAGDGDHEADMTILVTSSDLDANHDADLPVKVRSLSDIVSEVEEQEPHLHVLSSEEPASLIEAQADLS